MQSNNSIVMCGCHEAGVPLIKFLISKGVRFSYFVTITEEQAKKNKVSGYFNYSEIAKENSIPIYIPHTYTLKSEEDRSFFEEQKFDLLIQGGWQRLFPDFVLESLKIGAIGIHGSSDYLPKGRGRSPLNWSLIEGKKRFILSAFLMKPGVDDGDVFATTDFDINEWDDIRTLYYKVGIACKRMIWKNLENLLLGKLKHLHSQVGTPSYYPKRTEEDGAICWETMDVHQVYNLIRATTKPYPGAFAVIEGRTTKIWKSRVFDTRITYPENSYGDVVEDFGVHKIINCRGGLLLLEDWSCAE